MQGARLLPPDKHPDISGALSETVDISIPPQPELVKSAGFDHLGFGEVTVQVEYCALPIDVGNNCNSTGPINIYDSSRYTVQQGRMTFHRLCRALNLKIEHDGIYRLWLIKYHGVDGETRKTSKNKFFMKGLVLPPPQGQMWRNFRKRQLQLKAGKLPLTTERQAQEAGCHDWYSGGSHS